MQKSENELVEQGGNNNYSQSNINDNEDGTETTTNIDENDYELTDDYEQGNTGLILTTIPLMTKDIKDKDRPTGNLDIGAYEF